MIVELCDFCDSRIGVDSEGNYIITFVSTGYSGTPPVGLPPINHGGDPGRVLLCSNCTKVAVKFFNDLYTKGRDNQDVKQACS